MRLFIAIDLLTEIKEKVRGYLDALTLAAHRAQAEVKWARANQIHYTLKFLGECQEEQVLPISQSLAEGFTGTAPFLIVPGELGYFPERGAVQGFWIGLKEGREAVVDLAERVEAVCEGLQFPREKRPFSPHLTLGQVKTVPNPRVLRSLLGECPVPEFGGMTVDSIQLVRSILSPAGPTYTILKTIGL